LDMPYDDADGLEKEADCITPVADISSLAGG
jgi:hypothetical protein